MKSNGLDSKNMESKEIRYESEEGSDSSGETFETASTGDPLEDRVPGRTITLSMSFQVPENFPPIGDNPDLLIPLHFGHGPFQISYQDIQLLTPLSPSYLTNENREALRRINEDMEMLDN